MRILISSRFSSPDLTAIILANDVAAIESLSSFAIESVKAFKPASKA